MSKGIDRCGGVVAASRAFLPGSAPGSGTCGSNRRHVRKIMTELCYCLRHRFTASLALIMLLSVSSARGFIPGGLRPAMPCRLCLCVLIIRIASGAAVKCITACGAIGSYYSRLVIVSERLGNRGSVIIAARALLSGGASVCRACSGNCRYVG